MLNFQFRFRRQEWGKQRRKTYFKSCFVSNKTLDLKELQVLGWGAVKGRDKYKESQGGEASFFLRTIGNIKVKSKARLEG